MKHIHCDILCRPKLTYLFCTLNNISNHDTILLASSGEETEHEKNEQLLKEYDHVHQAIVCMNIDWHSKSATLKLPRKLD